MPTEASVDEWSHLGLRLLFFYGFRELVVHIRAAVLPAAGRPLQRRHCVSAPDAQNGHSSGRAADLHLLRGHFAPVPGDSAQGERRFGDWFSRCRVFSAFTLLFSKGEREIRKHHPVWQVLHPRAGRPDRHQERLRHLDSEADVPHGESEGKCSHPGGFHTLWLNLWFVFFLLSFPTKMYLLPVKRLQCWCVCVLRAATVWWLSASIPSSSMLRRRRRCFRQTPSYRCRYLLRFCWISALYQPNWARFTSTFVWTPDGGGSGAAAELQLHVPARCGVGQPLPHPHRSQGEHRGRHHGGPQEVQERRLQETTEGKHRSHRRL